VQGSVPKPLSREAHRCAGRIKGSVNLTLRSPGTQLPWPPLISEHCALCEYLSSAQLTHKAPWRQSNHWDVWQWTSTNGASQPLPRGPLGFLREKRTRG